MWLRLWKGCVLTQRLYRGRHHHQAPSQYVNFRELLHFSPFSNFQHFEGLADWVKVFEEFREVVFRETLQLAPGQPKDSNIQHMLLRSLVRTVSSQKKAKISTNLLAAALHLSFLKSAVQNKLVLELPDDPLSLAQRLVASHHIEENCADLQCSIQTEENQLDDYDIKYLNDYTKSIGGPGLAGLRNPLHLALAVSPLFLLLPQSLAKKHVSRKTLILVGVT